MELSESYAGIRARILTEFEALADYIWKTPRLIETERELERQKLFEYFPDSADPEIHERNKGLRATRALLEGFNLTIRFPKYMASSNLFVAASLFEYFLLALCHELETEEITVRDQRGNGVRRFFSFFRLAGISPDSIELHAQVDALITVRNAMLHANGNLELSRERDKIKGIVEQKTFIEPSRRALGGMDDERGCPEIAITGDGSQLRINNYFAFRACNYFKTYLLALGADVQERRQ